MEGWRDGRDTHAQNMIIWVMSKSALFQRSLCFSSKKYHLPGQYTCLFFFGSTADVNFSGFSSCLHVPTIKIHLGYFCSSCVFHSLLL
jgi:hypothetical protein